jgi:LmbE family N-acetylglucosaminyl deacetylase
VAVPKEKFVTLFNKPLVEKELIQHVKKFNPSVIFTLDNEIGAYGHPEHVFISQMVLDLSKSGAISPVYVYQNVYTKHMAESIMKRLADLMQEWGFDGDQWENSKKVYNVNGMPQPTVQVSILKEADTKMEFLESYNERERKTINFYVPAFEEYSADEYFSIFDREFFRVIKTN